MVFNKLFKKKNTPDNVGNPNVDLDSSTEVVNKIYLAFPELEGEPTFELENALTVGSQVGQAIIDDESVAPRHCTFTHTQDVISVMDHGSAEGTFINKKQIEPGRIFILQQKDKIKIGELKAEIQVQEVEIPIQVVEEIDDSDLDAETLERMQALASGQAPPPTPADEVTPPETPDVPDEDIPDLGDDTGELEEDMLLDDHSESDLTTSDLEVPAEEELDDLEDEIEKEVDEVEEQVEKTLANLSLEEKSMILSKAPKELKDREFDWDEDLENLTEEEIDERTRKILKATGGKVKLKAKKSSVREAANTFPRMLAMLVEVIIVVYLLKYLYPITQFKDALDKYPKIIWTQITNLTTQFVKPHYNLHAKVHVDKILKDVPAIEKMFIEAINFLVKNPEALAGIYLFIVIRLATPILFGVSIGQGMVGIKALGNFIVKRITGPIRELIGLITFPLIIFDLTALFSKRTLKEILSFSHLVSGSMGKTIFLTILWLILFILGYVFSPLIERGNIPKVIPVEVYPLNSEPVQLADLVTSKDLRLKGQLPEKIITFPKFVVAQKGKERKILSTYELINTDTGDQFNISRIRGVNLASLLSKGITGNYLAAWKYPEILKITNDVSSNNSNFKTSEVINLKKVLPELQSMLNGSFALSLETMQSHLIKHGPFLIGYLNFRESLLGLVEEPIKNIEVDEIGKTPFLILKNANAKNIYALSLASRKADLYKITLSKKNEIYKSVLENIGFSQMFEEDQEKINDFFGITDHLMKFTQLNKDKFQMLYENLFNESKLIMMSNDKFLIKNLRQSVESIVQFVELMENPEKDKFYQNISDLLKALKDEDKQFFGIKQVKAAKAY